MHSTFRLVKLIALAAIVGHCLTRTEAFGQSTAQSVVPPGVMVPTPIDVKLRSGGEMSAIVRDPTGAPQSGVGVAVFHQGVEVAAGETDDEGRFSVAGLRRGSHIVQVQDVSNPVRLWPDGVAPPQAIEDPVITAPRGQAAVSQAAGGVSGEIVEVQQGYRRTPLRQGPLRRMRNAMSRVFANYPILATTALVGAGIGSGVAIGANNNPASP